MYKKREIDLQRQVDYEFRRIEDGMKRVEYQRYDYVAKGGEKKTVIKGGYVKGSLLFFVNGTLKQPGVFYKEVDPEKGELEHTQLNPNDWVLIIYQGR